jgi:hypothetical protein
MLKNTLKFLKCEQYFREFSTFLPSASLKYLTRQLGNELYMLLYLGIQMLVHVVAVRCINTERNWGREGHPHMNVRLLVLVKYCSPLLGPAVPEAVV